MIDLRCSCGKTYHADDSHLGKSLRCTECGRILKVEASLAPPQAESVTRPPAARGPLSKPATIDVGRRRRKRKGEAWTALAAMGFVALVIFVVDFCVPWLRARLAAPAPVPACAVGRKPERPATGSRIKPDEGTSGGSSLEITNGSDLDAAVRLVDNFTNRASRFVYVRAKEKQLLNAIEPGSYSLRYASGSDWTEACLDFLRDEDLEEFEEPVTFRAGYISTWTVSLNPVPEGTAKTRKIDRKRFLEGDR